MKQIQITQAQKQLIIEGLKEQLSLEDDIQREEVIIELPNDNTCYIDLIARCSFWYEVGDNSHTDGGGLASVDLQINSAEIVDADGDVYKVALNEKELSWKLLT